MRQLRQEEIQKLEAMVITNGGQPLNVAVYARKSREDKENISISQQIEACKEFINEHSHLFTLKPEHVYSEDNVSGFYIVKRKEFQKLLDKTHSKEVRVIVVTKMDRLTRSSTDTFSLATLFNNLGVVLISGDDQGDYSATGVFAKQVIAASNEFTVRRAIEDTMASKKRKAEQGFSCGGPGSFGYKVEEKRYVIDPIESLAVEKIYLRYIGGNSLSEIADSLNSEGYKTRTNKKFTKSRVLEILRNERNYGKNTWNSEKKRKKRNRISYINFPEVVSMDAVEKPIISKEIFDKAQALLNSRTQGRKRTRSSNYFLTGLIKCSCGSNMVGNTTRGGRNHNIRRTYICSARKEKHSCTNKDINADYIESLIKNHFNGLLNQLITDKGLPQNVVDSHNSFYTCRIMEINNEINRTQKLMEKLVTQKASATQINIIEALDRSLTKQSELLNHLTNTKNHLSERLESLKSSLENFKGKDWFSNLSLAREFLENQIETIVADSNDITFKFE